MSEFKRDIKDWCRIIDLKEHRVLLVVEEDHEEGPAMTMTTQLEGVRVKLGLGFNDLEDAFAAMDSSTAEQLEETIVNLKAQMLDPDVDSRERS